MPKSYIRGGFFDSLFLFFGGYIDWSIMEEEYRSTFVSVALDHKLTNKELLKMEDFDTLLDHLRRETSRKYASLSLYITTF